jgi:hypothetical protein
MNHFHLLGNLKLRPTDHEHPAASLLNEGEVVMVAWAL